VLCKYLVRAGANTLTDLWHKTRQAMRTKKRRNVQDEKRFGMPVQERHRLQGCVYTRGRGEVLGQAGVAKACAYTLIGV